jgi:hypothetical protein
MCDVNCGFHPLRRPDFVGLEDLDGHEGKSHVRFAHSTINWGADCDPPPQRFGGGDPIRPRHCALPDAGRGQP